MKLTSDLKVAILADHGVHQAELAGSREKLEMAGIKVSVISLRKPEIKAWNGEDWANRIRTDKGISESAAQDFDGLIIPGGPLHADHLRSEPGVTNLLRQFFSAGKVIGTIGHGIQVLITAEIIDGRSVTSIPSVKTDVILAGGIWLNESVVEDNGLVTCRCGEDIDEFNKVYMEQLRQGVHQRAETII